MRSRFKSRFQSRFVSRFAGAESVYRSAAGAAGYSYTNTEAQTFEDNADTTGWDDALRGDIDQLFSDLKSGQVNSTNTLAELDFLYLHDLPNQSDSLRCLISPATRTATAVNAPTHTANEGFTGNGSNSYVDLNFTPSTDGVNWTLNSAFLGVWVRSADTGFCGYMGAGVPALSRSTIGQNSSSGVWEFTPPNSGGFVENGSAFAPTGLLAADRDGSSSSQGYVNGVSDASSSISSTSINQSTMVVLAANPAGTPTWFSEGQISASLGGGSLTANQHADLYDALDRYRTARELAASGLEVSDEDAAEIIVNMDTAPTQARATLIDNLVSGLKTDGIWSKLDRLWVMAAHDAQAARLDWKNPATSGNMLTAVNTPTFTTDQGYTGNGSTSYLNTNYDSTGGGLQFGKDSASMGVYVRQHDPNAFKWYMGVGGASNSDRTQILTGATTDDLTSRINDTVNLDATGLGVVADGLIAVNRSGSSARQLYRNGSQIASDTQASDAERSGNIFLLALNNNGSAFGYSVGQISMAFAGGSLTATEHSNLSSRFSTYLGAL